MNLHIPKLLSGISQSEDKITSNSRYPSGHFHENLENGLTFYSLNLNGLLHVFDRT